MKLRIFKLKWSKIAICGFFFVYSLTAYVSDSTSCVNGSTLHPLVISTDKGAVKGFETDTTRNFYGIPYAAPPVGALRWKAPQPAAAWETVRDATQFAAHCPQPPTPFGSTNNSSEDCLYLNVYQPIKGGSHPVMFYMHGGGLFTGESEDWDPTQLVEKDVVVVTINYRLGALGFLTHPALSTEEGTGNWGIMDQQAALRWVKTNIKAFGGNPHNVTIFGESAGGASVIAHLVSKASKGLFHKAIIQSGAYNLDTPSLAVSQANGLSVVAAVGCDNSDQSQIAACLRELSVDTLLANQSPLLGPTLIVPTVDNVIIKQTFRAALASGNFSHVPVITGSNRLEASLFNAFYFDINPLFGPVNAGNYPMALFIMSNFSEAHKTADEINAEYPLDDYATPSVCLDTWVGDSAHICESSSLAILASKYTTVYQYEFDDPNAPMRYLPPSATHPPWGAYHTSELQYLFNVTGAPIPATLDASQQHLSEQMIGFWTQFAKTGNPNAHGRHWHSRPVWPAYSVATDAVLSLDPLGLHLVSPSFRVAHHCHFWYGD